MDKQADGDFIMWCIHSMTTNIEMFRLYHNNYAESLVGRPYEYLFARYARDVFHESVNFIQASQPRNLVVRKANGQMLERMFSPQECRLFAQGMRFEEVEAETKEARELDTIRKSVRDAARLSAADQRGPRGKHPVKRSGIVSSTGSGSASNASSVRPRTSMSGDSQYPEPIKTRRLLWRNEGPSSLAVDEIDEELRGRKRRRTSLD